MQKEKQRNAKKEKLRKKSFDRQKKARNEKKSSEKKKEQSSEKQSKKSWDSDDCARGGNACLHIVAVHKLRRTLALLDHGLFCQLIHLLDRCGHSQMHGCLARVVHCSEGC